MHVILVDGFQAVSQVIEMTDLPARDAEITLTKEGALATPFDCAVATSNSAIALQKGCCVWGQKGPHYTAN